MFWGTAVEKIWFMNKMILLNKHLTVKYREIRHQLNKFRIKM